VDNFICSCGVLECFFSGCLPYGNVKRVKKILKFLTIESLKMTYKNTGVMCILTVHDPNREDGFKYVDLGNYFTDEQGNKFLITSHANAKEYSNQINVPILVRKEGKT